MQRLTSGGIRSGSSFKRGCVGLSLIRLGHLDEAWPHLIKGAKVFEEFGDAMKYWDSLVKDGKADKYAWVAVQTSGPLLPSRPDEPGGLLPGEIDPRRIDLGGLFNFVTWLAAGETWEWMNHFVGMEGKVEDEKCEVKHRKAVPADPDYKTTVWAIVPLSATNTLPKVRQK